LDNEKTTHFGYQEVPVEDKVQRVAGVFHSVADKYDLMNDLMSMGVHRLWKRFTIHSSGIKKGSKVLDIAGGTGDLTLKFSKLVGRTGQVILADINASMLNVGRDRLTDQGIVNNIDYVEVMTPAMSSKTVGEELFNYIGLTPENHENIIRLRNPKIQHFNAYKKGYTVVHTSNEFFRVKIFDVNHELYFEAEVLL